MAVWIHAVRGRLELPFPKHDRTICFAMRANEVMLDGLSLPSATCFLTSLRVINSKQSQGHHFRGDCRHVWSLSSRIRRVWQHLQIAVWGPSLQATR